MKSVITISRQYGSGGRIIGQQTAERLGFAFYDSEIIEQDLIGQGLTQDMVEYGEQRDKAAEAFCSIWL